MRVVGGSGQGALKVAVARKGAELLEVTRECADGTQLSVLWRNGEAAPPEDGFWRRHAPILFPVVGGVHGNRSVTSDGTQVRLPGAHGFFRNSMLELLRVAQEEGGARLVYALESSPATLEMYPWRFGMEVAYSLLYDRIEVSITVTNRDSRPMPFQLGWHPGINVPLAFGSKGRTRIVLPVGRMVRMLNDAQCYLTGEAVPFDSQGRFEFTESELDGTYMFDVSAVAAEDRVVEVVDEGGCCGVRVAFPDYPHLGLWSNAHAPFVCVEPWQGMDDRVVQEPFDCKFGMVSLGPGFSRTWRASLRVLGGPAAAGLQSTGTSGGPVGGRR